ncbi:MAG: type II toxin-antitoxin system VapC family toxin [Burkholderiaceae bacterium]|nr:type II toxin-antitoxin system VapC family toxin [Roseateles sp.]MBV8471090.1 type II toxin-antitoxin system VapC family toxin [Burkholderiaceae bacterium]
MRLLLDTHIFLWAVTDSPRLKAATRRLIEEAEQTFVSAASIWEVAIKARLGKIDADPQALASAIVASGFAPLSVSAVHAAGVAQLEPHHNDPFDRLLVAQALAEPLRLVTSDEIVAQYSDLVLLV